MGEGSRRRRRPREAGFDEEAVNKRDTATLVAYIAKLESELYDYPYNMGLIILEIKEWTSKYEQAKAAAELAETIYKRDQAAHLTALAEVRNQEESLKRALAVKKEGNVNIEKALHDMRAEFAKTKLAYETQMVEAREMMEKKFEEPETKVHLVELMQANTSHSCNTALINLQDVEAHEDEIRRHLISFESECDSKEKELNHPRQILYDSQRILNQEQDRLLEGQTLLNQREDYICGRLKELSRFEKELDEKKKPNLKKNAELLKKKK